MYNNKYNSVVFNNWISWASELWNVWKAAPGDSRFFFIMMKCETNVNELLQMLSEISVRSQVMCLRSMKSTAEWVVKCTKKKLITTLLYWSTCVENWNWFSMNKDRWFLIALFHLISSLLSYIWIYSVYIYTNNDFLKLFSINIYPRVLLLYVKGNNFLNRFWLLSLFYLIFEIMKRKLNEYALMCIKGF